jgi:outer membrane protein W
MKTKILIAIALLITTTGFSQGNLFTINYTMSFASGETSDFISKASFRGVSFDGRSFLTDNVSIGGHINWTTFYEKLAEDTYTQDKNTITGTQFRYLNSTPILFNAHYYTGVSDQDTRFYVGVGVGTYYMNKETEMGVWSVRDDNWHFGFAPEIGVLIPVAISQAVNVSLKWNYALKSNDTINYSWFGLNVGYAWGN